MVGETEDLLVTLFNSRSELANQESTLFKRSVEFGCMARKVCELSGSAVGQTLVNLGSLGMLLHAVSEISPQISDSASKSDLGVREFVGSFLALLPVGLFSICNLALQPGHFCGFFQLGFVPECLDRSFALALS